MKMLTTKNDIEGADTFAWIAHQGQLDDSGEEYIEHPRAVAKIIKIVCPQDENLICAALLHDVIEDTDRTYDEIKEKFGEDVADLVNEVSHDGKKDTIGFWFPRLRTKRGIVLKFADRISNLSRMDCWGKQRQDQYMKRSKFWKSEPGNK